jgi:hypothetical protein
MSMIVAHEWYAERAVRRGRAATDASDRDLEDDAPSARDVSEKVYE